MEEAYCQYAPFPLLVKTFTIHKTSTSGAGRPVLAKGIRSEACLVLHTSREACRSTECWLLQYLNFANFDLPGNALNGLLTGAAGQINGTTSEGHNITRVGVGTGVYSLGAPRQIEFGLRLSFGDILLVLSAIEIFVNSPECFVTFRRIAPQRPNTAAFTDTASLV